MSLKSKKDFLSLDDLVMMVIKGFDEVDKKMDVKFENCEQQVLERKME